MARSDNDEVYFDTLHARPTDEPARAAPEPASPAARRPRRDPRVLWMIALALVLAALSLGALG